MKSKKGFTLIELIAVIALASIIVVIAVYSVKDAGSNIKAKDYENKINLIETSAIFYAQDNITSYPQTITIQDLIESKYLEVDIEENSTTCTSGSGCLLNPINNSSMNALEIIISKVNNNVVAEVQNN